MNKKNLVRKMLLMMMCLLLLSLAVCACSEEGAADPADVAQSEHADGVPAVHSDGEGSSQDTAGTISVEKDEAVSSQASRLYNLSLTDDTEGYLGKYAVGFSPEGDDKALLYNGDIGSMIDAYKDIDLNGDGTPDSITRSAEEKDGEISVSFDISIANGPSVQTPVITDYADVYGSGGDVFEFNDINNDGCDEVLHTRYYSSTAGFQIAEAILYHVRGNNWEGYDLGADLEGMVGAELTDDGLAVLVDYADKWSRCYDVFLYKMTGDDVKCTGNASASAKDYWPIRYNNSFSVAGSLSDEGKSALSEIYNSIWQNGKLPDGTDVSAYVEAAGEMTDNGFYKGVIWFTIVDLGRDDEFGIRIWASMRGDTDALFVGEETDRLFAYNMTDKKAYLLSDLSAFRYYEDGYFVMSTADYSEYHACRYDSSKHSLEVICSSDDVWSDEITNALADRKMITDLPEFCLNRNYKMYRTLGSTLTIIDNGQGSPGQSDMQNEYYHMEDEKE